VPIEKLRRLCKEIVEEDDPETLTRRIAELTEHLRQEQVAIKAKISQYNRRAGNSPPPPHRD
jgi:ribosomal protein S15P/S13E